MKRVVVKVGTAVLTTRDGNLDREFINSLCSQMARARELGWEVICVTSGAIRAGAERLKLKRRPQLLPEKQAAAAVGQGLLLQLYSESLASHQITSAQVLLTRDDFSDRSRYLNARNTLMKLLDYGVVPIINENDTVSVAEIRFGDNDMLASLVGTIVEADLVMLLTDVPGLCWEKPKRGSEPKVISVVEEITPELENIAAGGDSERGGTGGMASKLEAARVAMASGVALHIVPGREPDVVLRSIAGEELGTRFQPSATRLNSRKRWIAFAVPVRGSIKVNENAAKYIVSHNKSLLAVGITDVSGEFESGELVRIINEQGQGVARGFVNYNSDEVRRIMGQKSSEIAETLGYKAFDEVIHRDNLVPGV